MCGYVRRHIGGKALQNFVDLLGLPPVFAGWPEEPVLQHFYPAFGSAAKQIKQLIVREEGETKAIDATWWFECAEVNGILQVNNDRTTFNARNLASPYWKAAIRRKRAIVVATALGEGKGKSRYFMEAEQPFLMGAVYRSFPNQLYSTAIITRDAHPRFDKYHDKAFPLFLPSDPKFVELWLSDEPETHPEIAHLLEHPKVFNPFKVTPVKTFKDGVALGESENLEAD